MPAASRRSRAGAKMLVSWEETSPLRPSAIKSPDHESITSSYGTRTLIELSTAARPWRTSRVSTARTGGRARPSGGSAEKPARSPRTRCESIQNQQERTRCRGNRGSVTRVGGELPGEFVRGQPTDEPASLGLAMDAPDASRIGSASDPYLEQEREGLGTWARSIPEQRLMIETPRLGATRAASRQVDLLHVSADSDSCPAVRSKPSHCCIRASSARSPGTWSLSRP